MIVGSRRKQGGALRTHDSAGEAALSRACVLVWKLSAWLSAPALHPYATWLGVFGFHYVMFAIWLLDFLPHHSNIFRPVRTAPSPFSRRRPASSRPDTLEQAHIASREGGVLLLTLHPPPSMW